MLKTRDDVIKYVNKWSHCNTEGQLVISVGSIFYLAKSAQALTSAICNDLRIGPGPVKETRHKNIGLDAQERHSDIRKRGAV
ncbi:MAG TPA: hypothetical protein ENH30_01440 [Nitrospirae bacterium]|nr:hypothetical protein [Nitrospirota bacterium]